jgi:hypothetical protein
MRRKALKLIFVTNRQTYIKTGCWFITLCWQYCPILWALKSTPIQIKCIRRAAPSKVIATATHWGCHWIFSLDKAHDLINLKFIDTMGSRGKCNTVEAEDLTLGWLKRLVWREGLREPWKGSCRWPFNLQKSYEQGKQSECTMRDLFLWNSTIQAYDYDLKGTMNLKDSSSSQWPNNLVGTEKKKDTEMSSK